MFSRTFDSAFVLRCLLGVFLLLGGGRSSAQAQEGTEPLQGGELLTGQRMRFAFRDVVNPAVPATVGILADGERIALGTIVESDGWIISKGSQIAKADRVELSDGRQFAARIVGIHHKLDLGLLKIETSGLPVVTWEEQEPPLGAWMVSVGLPPDYVGAVGVMSVPRHTIPRSDAHGYLGVELEMELEDLPTIKKVIANGAASAAGLMKGDIVLALDQHTVLTPRQLVKTLKEYHPGDTLSLRVRRAEAEIAYSVTLMHPYGDNLSRMAFQNQMGGDLSFRRDDFEAVLQHDSVIDPKDCGGPVVNLQGHALGVNIARAGRTESYAIPADLILAVIPELKASSFPQTPMHVGPLQSTSVIDE